MLRALAVGVETCLALELKTSHSLCSSSIPMTPFVLVMPFEMVGYCQTVVHSAGPTQGHPLQLAHRIAPVFAFPPRTEDPVALLQLPRRWHRSFQPSF